MPSSRRRGGAGARARRVTPATVPPSALVAAATNYSKTPIKSTAAVTGEGYSSKRSPKKPSAESWQTTAWTFYDLIGEFRYGVDWTGNLMSRVVLEVHKDGAVTTDQKALDLLDALFAGPEGQSEMLRLIGKHWSVTGDCFIIGDKWDTDDPDWLVAANTATTVTNEGNWKVNDEEFKKSALVIRVWRPHPTNRQLADSPARAVLPILAEIDGLTKHVAAQIDSRLAGAGILFIPKDMTFSSARPEEPADGQEPDPAEAPKTSVDALVRTLIEVMSTAIADREDPSALVPIIVSADGESIKNVKHQTFSTPLDEKAIELRSEAIRRLALGMDMPPEVLMGTADLNHWSSWQIEEAAIKAHLEPLLEEICASLTEEYLRASLDSADAGEYSIVANTSALRLRPNRSKEAIELFNMGQLSPKRLLIENGFDEADVMSDQELQRWLTVKIAGGSATPEQVLAALEALGVKLNVQAPQAPADAAGTPDTGEAPRESRPAPSTKDHPVRAVPDAPADGEAA